MSMPGVRSVGSMARPPSASGITRDDVTVWVDAVVYFPVIDPIKATINVQNYLFAVSQQAQTSLRSIIGQSELGQRLAERNSFNRELRRDRAVLR
jgi:regulator of protease activity HflC (stomatin/prohibitin superfamily)